MIQIEHVSKTFREKALEVHALRDVSIHVLRGDIFGIVGFSGAGKSTLLRLVNKLETPDTGSVRVAGQALEGLEGKALHALRRRIGMVFQQFNLLYAIPYGLIPSCDGLIIEKQSEAGDNPYVNIIVARTADADNAVYQTVVKAYQTQLVAEFLLVNYSEAFFPAFPYDSSISLTAEEAQDIVAYTSDKAGKTVVTVGVCGANNDQWKAVQKVLDEENAGIYIELVEFDAYNLPNEALNSGEIDLNAFQHKAYLNKDAQANGYDLTVIGDTLIAPLTLYSEKYDSLDALKEAAGRIKQ
ncbi:MAG: MetQ/NlpA family ABC transporter substrate-binding protein [Clostridiales bacterium]|nr:MetQ/NlpA family ABC transporter substrate-binding protein [Clostridiales bacterium]